MPNFASIGRIDLVLLREVSLELKQKTIHPHPHSGDEWPREL